MTVLDVPDCDVVTWVPLARERLVRRGYDQARSLAAPVAVRAGVPCRALLRRTSSTPPQARRRGAERRTALRLAFAPTRSAPGRVLLVDDVLTTGATASGCARALRDAGAREVHVLTASRSFSARAYTQTGSRPGLWLPGDVPR